MFVMDKHKSIPEKTRILAQELAKVPHEDLYIMPAVRELLEKYSRKSVAAEGRGADATEPHKP